MDFKLKDKKLLSYLYHNYREPFTKIAKSCKVSRDQVEYSIEKYKKQELIKKFLTIFDYNALGYNEFIIVWLKSSGDNSVLRKDLEKMKNVSSVGDAMGKYDLFVNFIFKDKNEFESIFYPFLKKNRTKIGNYSIMPVTSLSFFPLKTFGDNGKEEVYTPVIQTEINSLDGNDLAILKLLERDGRAKIIDIASKVNLSSEVVIYRLKQLYKKGIILGNRIQFNMEKMGFNFASFKLKVASLDGLTRDKLEDFCKEHQNINALSFGVSDFNCLIQFFYQEEQELREGIKNVRDFIGKDILDSELLLIGNEGRVKTLPL